MATHATPQAPLLEYLTTTRIGEKGQLTVPKEFREDLGLAAGAPFAVLRLGGRADSSARTAALQSALR